MSLPFGHLTSLPLLMETALEQAFNSVLITDALFTDDGPHIIYANQSFCRMTGYALDELLGSNPRILQGELTDRVVINRLKKSLHDEAYFFGSTVNYRKNGEPYDVEWNITPVRGTTGQVECFISIQQDVSSRNQSQRELVMLAGALNCADDAIFICDRQQKIVFANQSFEKLTGYTLEEVLGKTPAILSTNTKDEQTDQSVRRVIDESVPYRGIMRNRHKDGTEFFVHQSISPLALDVRSNNYFVSISKDITQRIEERQALEEMALQDSLTQILNRRGAELMLGSCLDESSLKQRPVTLAIADVDLFKQFNDNYGHEAGDKVLVAVAKLFEASLRSQDIVARWGGEEFLVALPSADMERAFKLIERLRLKVQQISLEGLPTITVSFGLAQYRLGEQLPQLLKRADAALYKAKHLGRNRVQLESHRGDE